MLIVPPENVKDDVKLFTHCCVSGCKINSKTNPDVIFHVLNTENFTFQNCKIQELKICDEHYLSTDSLNLSVENITSNSSELNTPIFEVIPTNYDPITNFFDTAPSPSQTEIDANMPELNLTEDLQNDDSEVCRVCLLGGNLKNIETEIVDNKPIKNMLQKFNHLNNPNFPRKICETCINDLKITNNFLIQYENSTKQLNSNYEKSFESETFQDRQTENGKIDNKYDLIRNIEKCKRQIVLLEKFTKENLSKLKRHIEKNDRKNRKMLKEIYKSRALNSMQFKTKNRFNKNRKLKRGITKRVTNKTKSKLTNEIRKKSSKQINMTVKNIKVNKDQQKCEIEDKTMLESTVLQHKNEFPKIEKNSFDLLPVECKQRIIEISKRFSQKEILEKIVELFKLRNPFLTDVIITEDLKKNNGEKNKKRRGRKPSLKTLTLKNRVLIVTMAQITEIIEKHIFSKGKLENPPVSLAGIKISAKAYPCTSCNKCFLSEDFLNRHYCDAEKKTEIILKTNEFKCEICLRVFDSLLCLEKHHCLGTFDCKRCRNKYETIDELKWHIGKKHPLSDPKKFQCEFCGREYKKQAYVKKHMMNKHYDVYVLPTKEKARKC